jgi:hypothetical protein
MPGKHSSGKWWVTGLASLILLSGSSSTRAEEYSSTGEPASTGVLRKLFSAAGRAGQTALGSIATGDYRAYGLADFLPLEEVFLPGIALPAEQHPCLLFSENQKDLIRQRTLREPYARWWRTILQRAESSLTKDLSDRRLDESLRATAAKSCAFAYLITGELSFLDKARQGLLHISPPPAVTTPEGGKTGQGWGDWIRASALMLIYCVAYDLVAEDLSAQDRRLVTEKLAAEADQLYKNLKFAPPNNHKTIMAVAVGTAALTIPAYGSGEPQVWLDAAMGNLRSGLAQIDRDGSYREGVFYAGYISRLIFPFALYLKKTTACDLFEHRRFQDLTQWLIRIGKPDGSIPLFDDTWQKQYHFLPILVGHSRLGGIARWIYERQPAAAGEQLNEVEYICAFDDRVPPQPPPWERTTFFPDGGMAVFGDGWSASGIYLLFLGEGKKALASGHEHIDPGNFVLQAHGQDLIIDTGYGPKGRISAGRSWYLGAEGHNMLLVDGKGPNMNPFSPDQRGGQLVNCFRSTKISGAAVRTRYRGTEIQRTVHFLGQRYFLIFDRLESAEPHNYQLVLHGMGKAQLEEPERVSWSPGTGKLQVEFLSPEKSPTQISLRTGQNTPHYGSWETHTYIRTGKTRRKKAHFSTLLLPQRDELCKLECVDLPVISSGLAQAREISGEGLGGARHLLVATDGQRASAAGITTDGLVCVTGLGISGQREFFTCVQGTFYAHLTDTCYISDRPITVSMITETDRWSGHVDAGQEVVVIQMETGFDPGQVRFGQFPMDYEYRAGKVKLRLKGSGPLELGHGPPVIFTPQSSRDRYPFLEQLARQQEPMARYEELSPEQRFLTNRQALDITLEQMNKPVQKLSQKMGLGPDGLSKTLGLVTGLADQTYDPHNWARLNLPQHLEGQKSLPLVELSYTQQGRLTQNGWRMERLEGQLSRGSWGSVKVGQYSPFPEVVHRTLHLGLGSFSLATELERMEGAERKQFSAFHYRGPTTWGVEGYTQDGSDDYGIIFLARGPTLTAEVSQYRGPQGALGRRLFLSRSGPAFSPQAELLDQGAAGGKDLRVSWASVPMKGVVWEFSSLLGQISKDPYVREVNNRVLGRGKTLSGQLYSSYQNGLGSYGWATLLGQRGSSRWTLRASFHQQARPFIIEEFLSCQQDLGGWISSAASITHQHHSPVGNDAVHLALSAQLRAEKTTRFHLNLEGNSIQRRLVKWGLGVDFWGKIVWGCGWSRLWPPAGERRSQLSLHGAFTGWAGAGIKGRAELELTDEHRLEAYQIEIQQTGSPCSPGLLFSKSPLTGVRNDGFIRFRF